MRGFGDGRLPCTPRPAVCGCERCCGPAGGLGAAVSYCPLWLTLCGCEWCGTRVLQFNMKFGPTVSPHPPPHPQSQPAHPPKLIHQNRLGPAPCPCSRTAELRESAEHTHPSIHPPTHLPLRIYTLTTPPTPPLPLQPHRRVGRERGADGGGHGGHEPAEPRCQLRISRMSKNMQRGRRRICCCSAGLMSAAGGVDGMGLLSHVAN